MSARGKRCSSASRTDDVATVDAALVSQVLADLRSMPGNAVAGFASMGGALFRNSAGDLTIASAIDLGASGLNAPSWMGFEAQQDIRVNATISDGFASAIKDAALKSATPSFNLNFNSGRDIVVGADTIIRTGTGAIRMDAGRDLVLTNERSVIYTAGVKTPTAAGFVVGATLGDHPTARRRHHPHRRPGRHRPGRQAKHGGLALPLRRDQLDR